MTAWAPFPSIGAANLANEQNRWRTVKRLTGKGRGNGLDCAELAGGQV